MRWMDLFRPYLKAKSNQIVNTKQKKERRRKDRKKESKRMDRQKERKKKERSKEFSYALGLKSRGQTRGKE